MKDQTELPFSTVLTSILEDEQVPVHLLYRLSDMQQDEFDGFKQQWRATDEERRGIIARHMADIAEDNYVVDFAPVFAFLFGDESAAVRAAALDGLWDSTDLRLVEPIVAMLQRDPNPAVRAAAARALAHYVLLAEWGQISDRYTGRIVEALLAEYDKPTVALEVKRAALEAMASANHPRVPDEVLEAYEDGPFELQLSAVFAMGNTADKRWLPILEEEMTSPSPEMRAEAARAAGAIGDASMVDSLEQLTTDEDSDVVGAAIVALSQIGGDKASSILTEMSEDPEFEPFYDLIDEALEEMEWLGGEFDLLSFSEDEDDDLIDDLRAN